MTNQDIRSKRHIVQKDGVTLMFGQRPFGNNQQGVAVVDIRGFDAAHEQLLELERKNGLKDDES